MKMLWCWRCKAEMPMLDEREFQQVTSLRGKGMRLRDAFVPVMEEYERITGLKEQSERDLSSQALVIW